MNQAPSIKVGIMPFDQFKKYTLSIVKGDYKPHPNEPKIWFPSIKSLAHALSEENQLLLKLIIDHRPQSISALESLTGRKANNLLRTLRMMESYGLVKFSKGKASKGRAPLIPKVLYERVQIEVNFNKKS